jgi:AraC-like DNA-binding protein
MESPVGGVSWPLRACPQIVVAGRFTQDDRDFAHDYGNRSLTIHLFTYGATVRIGETEYEVRPGDLTVTAPGRALRFSICRPGVHWCIRLKPERSAGAGRMRLPVLRRLGQTGMAEARRRIETIIADHAQSEGRGPEHPLVVAAGLAAQNLLCWLAAGEPVAAAAYDPVDKARQLLANQQCARLPISEIARRCGLSQNRLALAFRRRHGVSMQQYRTRTLVETAMHLMQTTKLPMPEIRRRVELADMHLFNKVFRRVAGQGPRAWLRAQAPVVTSAARPEP